MMPPRVSTSDRRGARCRPSRGWGPAGRGAPMNEASDALEDHDRNLARRPLLILLIRRPDRGHRLPQGWLLRRRRRAGARFEAIRHDLHLHDRLRDEVLVPARVLRRAAARGDDEIVVAGAAVDQRRRPRLAGAPAGRRQEQGGDALPDMPVPAVAVDITARVRLLPAGWTAPGSGSCRHVLLRGAPADRRGAGAPPAEARL